jgi:hypothetical protein
MPSRQRSLCSPFASSQTHLLSGKRKFVSHLKSHLLKETCTTLAWHLRRNARQLCGALVAETQQLGTIHSSGHTGFFQWLHRQMGFLTSRGLSNNQGGRL